MPCLRIDRLDWRNLRERLAALALVAAWLALVVGGGLSGCSALRGLEPSVKSAKVPSWSGRLAIQVEGDPGKNFSSHFALWGSPAQGALELSTPTGMIFAQLRWDESGVQALVQGNEIRHFATPEAALSALCGVALPLSSAFAWLSGEPSVSAAQGWTVDLSSYAQGRIEARRYQPSPVVDLRLILDSGSTLGVGVGSTLDR